MARRHTGGGQPGHKQAPHHRGKGPSKRVLVTCPPPALETFEFLAYRKGITCSAWMLEAARAQAFAEGGDPDVGAP